MTRNVLTLVAAIAFAVLVLKVLAYSSRRFEARPFVSAAMYGLILVVSGTVVGSFATAVGASQWAVVGCLAIVCGSLAGRVVIDGISSQAKLRRGE